MKKIPKKVIAIAAVIVIFIIIVVAFSFSWANGRVEIYTFDINNVSNKISPIDINILSDNGITTNINEGRKIWQASQRYKVDGDSYRLLMVPINGPCTQEEVDRKNGKECPVTTNIQLNVAVPADKQNETKNLSDIVLNMEYVYFPGYLPVAIDTMRIKVNAENQEPKEVSIKAFELINVIKDTDDDSVNYGSIYKIQSENLKKDLPADAKITSIEILPYKGHGGYNGDLFYFSKISLVGNDIKLTTTQTQKVSETDEKTMRQNVINHMMEIIGIKWSTEREIRSWSPVDYKDSNDKTYYPQFYYNVGTLYTGIPYSPNLVHPTLEAFKQKIDSNSSNFTGEITVDDTHSNICYSGECDNKLYGLGCLSSVWDSLTSVLPFDYDVAQSRAFMANKDVKFAGGLKNNNETNPSQGTRNFVENLRSLYKNYIENNMYISARKLANRKIGSNDSRMWYVKAPDIDNNLIYYIGYSNVNQNSNYGATGIPENEALKLTIDNQNIDLEENSNLKVKYQFLAYNEYDIAVDTTAKVVINSDQVYNASEVRPILELKANSDAGNQEGKLYEIEFNINGFNDVVNKIEFMPYGDNAHRRGVFRLYSVEILRDDEEVIPRTTATEYYNSYKLSEYINNGLTGQIQSIGVNLLNSDEQDDIDRLTSRVASWIMSQMYDYAEELDYDEAVNLANMRIRSNDTRIWYARSVVDGNSMYYLGYTNRYQGDIGDTGIPENENLKLTLENQKISAKGHPNLKVRYQFLGYTDYDLPVDTTAKIIINSKRNYTASRVDAILELPNNPSANDKPGNLYEVEFEINDLNEVVKKIEFLPYGDSNQKNGIFRFYSIEILKNDERIFYKTASDYNNLYNLSAYTNNTLLQPEGVKLLNSTKNEDFAKLVSEISSSFVTLTASKMSYYDQALELANTRIRSNDTRIWYGRELDVNDNYLNYIGYTNNYSTAFADDHTGLPENEDLKLIIDNQNINVNGASKLKVKYQFLSYIGYDLQLDTTARLIINSNQTYTATEVTPLEELRPSSSANNKSGYLYEVVFDIDLSTLGNNIYKIEFLPYATGTPKWGIFRFYNVEILRDGKRMLKKTAEDYYNMFNLSIRKGSTKLSVDSERALNSVSTGELVSRIMASQEIFRAYAQTTLGDAIISYPERIHIRMITGNPKVKAIDGSDYTLDSGKLIDPTKSFVITTESTLVEAKNSNGYVNEEYPFSNIIAEQITGQPPYLPITFEQYKNSPSTPVWKMINLNTAENITEGLKGTINSNYRIRNVTYKISDNDGNHTQVFEDYPVGANLNYSLYYSNVKTEIDEYIASLGDGNYKLEVKALVGPYKEGKYQTKDVETINFEIDNIPNVRVVESIDVVDGPDKDTYVLNYDDLDLTGGTLQVNYDDGTNEVISMNSDDVSTSGYDATKEGVQEVRLEYQSNVVYTAIRVNRYNIFNSLLNNMKMFNKVIYNIDYNTNVSNLRFDINSVYDYKIFDSSSDTVEKTTGKAGTGDVMKIYTSNKLVDTYTLSVIADVNGDGEITPLDYIKIKNHIMNDNPITSFEYLNAADANRDGNVDPLDYIRIRNIIMNNEVSDEENN